MKSKKFNAAEKHFEKVQLRYQKQIKDLNERLDHTYNDVRLIRHHKEYFERENEELKQWIARLLEYTKLSEDDIKQAIANDKKMAEAGDWLHRLSDFMKVM